MTFWQSFAKKFGVRKRGLAEQMQISLAYQRVFKTNPSRDDQQMVLAHLAAVCGWNTITPPSVASKELWFAEGKRAAFAEIFSHLSLTPDDIAAMENAVRHEVAFNQN